MKHSRTLSRITTAAVVALGGLTACGAPTPLSTVHRQILERAEARGFGEADNSAVIEGLDAEPHAD